MTTYASTFRSGSSVNVAQLEDDINNKLPSRKALEFTAGSLQNTSGATPLTILSQSFTCGVDEVVDVAAECTLSASGSGTTCQVFFKIDGATQDRVFDVGNMRVGTDGVGLPVAGRFLRQDLSTGSHTLTIELIATSGTVYSLRQFASVICSKRRT